MYKSFVVCVCVCVCVNIHINIGTSDNIWQKILSDVP